MMIVRLFYESLYVAVTIVTVTLQSNQESMSSWVDE